MVQDFFLKKGFFAILYKEFIQLRRDPVTLGIMFLIPVIQLIIFGYAIDMDVKHFPTVIYNLDQRYESRLLIERFVNSQFFDIVAEVHSDQELEAMMISGKAKVAIKIPPDYSNTLLRKQSSSVLVLIDGSDSTVGTKALNVCQSIGLQESLARVGITTKIKTQLVDIRPRMLFNPDLKSANFMVPGLIGIIMQVVTVFLTAMAIVREKERGTLEQLLVSPVSKTALIMGKLVPYGIIGFVETLFVIAIMRYIFDVPIQGSLVLLLAISVVFLFCSLSIGIFISTVAQNQNQALQLGFLTMMPSILLSGFMFPRETMPLGIFAIGYVIPVTYFLEVLRGIIIRGAAMRELWDETLCLLVFWIVLVLLTVKRFKKTLS